MHRNWRRDLRSEGARGWCRGSYPSGSYRRSSYSSTSSGAASGRPGGRGSRYLPQRRHRNHLSRAHHLSAPALLTHTHTQTHTLSAPLIALSHLCPSRATLTWARFCSTRTPPAACPTHAESAPRAGGALNQLWAPILMCGSRKEGKDLVTLKTLVLLLTERASLREPRLTASRLAQNHVARRASHDCLRVAEHRGAARGTQGGR